MMTTEQIEALNLQVGDEVEVEENGRYRKVTIREKDRNFYFGKDYNGFFYKNGPTPESIKVLKRANYMLAVHCPTQADYSRVITKINFHNTHNSFRDSDWNIYREETALSFDGSGYSPREFYKEQGYTIISLAEALERLGGRREEPVCAPPLTMANLNAAYETLMATQYGRFMGVDTAFFSPFINESYTPHIKTNKPTLMSKATSFLRNLTLSADDKLLREMGLEDEQGNPTAEGYDLSDELDYKKNRVEIIELAKKMKAEADEKKN